MAVDFVSLFHPVYSQVSCHNLVKKDKYMTYYAYISVQSVITFDRLGRCFLFVYIYAIAVFSVLLPFLGE